MRTEQRLAIDIKFFNNFFFYYYYYYLRWYPDQFARILINFTDFKINNHITIMLFLSIMVLDFALAPKY